MAALCNEAEFSSVKVRYYIDPQTDAPHIYGHGVSELEVEEVLERPGDRSVLPGVSYCGPVPLRERVDRRDAS
jgi:hypothetical protein